MKDMEANLVDKVSNEEEEEKQRFCSVGTLRRFPLSIFFLLLLSSSMLAASWSIVKLVRDQVDIFLVIFVRYLVVMLMTAPMVAIGGMEVFPKGRMVMLFCRAAGAIAMLFANYYGLMWISMGDCRMIGAMGPIFVTLLARVFLKESFGFFELGNILVSLCGIFMVMQPPLLFGDEGDDYTVMHFTTAAVVLGGAFFGAVGEVASRSLKDINVFLMTFWSGFLGLLPALAAYIVMGEKNNPSLVNWMLIVANALLSYVAYLLNTLCFKLNDAGTVSLLNKTLQILLAFAVQLAVFAEIPNAIDIAGSCLLGVCVVTSGVRKMLQKKKPDSVTVKRICCL